MGQGLGEPAREIFNKTINRSLLARRQVRQVDTEETALLARLTGGTRL